MKMTIEIERLDEQEFSLVMREGERVLFVAQGRRVDLPDLAANAVKLGAFYLSGAREG